MVDTTVEIWQRDHLTTPGPPTKVADVTKGWGRRFTHAKNDYGSGSVNIQLDDTTAVAAAQPGRILKFKRGDDYHAFLLGPRRIRRVQRGEEAEHVLHVDSAPGVLAVLNDAPVQPTFGAGWLPWDGLRRWDWTNPLLDTTSWVAATELWRQGDPADLSASTFIEIVRDQGRFAFGVPEGYHDADSYWIWSSDYEGSPGTGGSGTLRMDPGTSYFHTTFTVAEDTFVMVQGACDDFFELALDGVVLITTAPAPAEAWSRAREWKGLISAGTHTLRAKTENYTRGFTNGNIAAFIAAVYAIAPASETIASVLARTNNTWKCLDYPATPPGFTAGDVYLTLLEEEQAEGFLLDIDPTFTAILDSDSSAWPLTDQITTRVGDPLGEVVRQICAQHADTRMNHDLTWDAWDKGSHGTATAVEYEIGVNISSLEFDGDAAPISSLLVLTQDGYIVVGDDSEGRQEYFDLSDLPAAEATERATAELADRNVDRWAATIRVDPQGGDVPLDDLSVLDTGTVPNPSGTTSVVECVEISWGEDERNGVEVLEPVFGDVILTPEERAAQQLHHTALGTLGGRVPLVPNQGVSGPGADSPTGPAGGSLPASAQTFEFPFHRTAADTDVTSDAWPAGAARTIFDFAVNIGAAQGTDTAVDLEVNGVTVATTTIPAGDTYAVTTGLAIDLSKDTDQIAVSAADTGFSLVAVARAR